MGGMSSVITLKDRYTATANKVSKSAEHMGSSLGKASRDSDRLTSSLKRLSSREHRIKIKDINDKKIRKQVSGIQTALRKTTGKKHQIDIIVKKSTKELLKGNFDALKNKVTAVKVNTVSLVKARLEAWKLSKELTKATGKRHKIRIVTDGASLKGALGKAGGMLGKGLKLGAVGALAGSAAALAGGGMLAGAMVGHGSDLEQQSIAMKHFLGGDEAKASDYLAELRKNANETPFGTTEVISAGTRAVQIAEGDTKKGMEFVKLAEDMAALNPGKTISDAMEALADAQMGEMERLKEFGFKGSQELFKAAGGDLFKMKSTTGKSLMEMYEGGAMKLAGSHKGKLSTISGNIESGMAESGLKIIEALSPALDRLIPVSEQVAAKLPQITESVLKYAVPAFKTAGTIIKDYVIPPLKLLGSGISAAVGTIKSIKSGYDTAKEKVGNWFSGTGNQTGTGSFAGGWTRANEQGTEMFQLPNRTKIYPSGKTDAMLSKEIRKTEQKTAPNISMVFNIHTAGNIDESMLSKMIAKQFEKALVNVS